MNIYLLTQEEKCGYGLYASVVVVAESEEQAKTIHPDYSDKGIIAQKDDDRWNNKWTFWASSPEKVEVKFIGRADKNIKEPTIILKSFNEG